MLRPAIKPWVFGIILFFGVGAYALDTALSVVDIMQKMTVHYNQAEEKFLQGAMDEELNGHLQELSNLFGVLRGAYKPVYRGALPSWEGYCDQSSAALAEVRAALSGKDIGLAHKSFYKLAAIREQAHRDFQPGLLKRFSRIFRKK